MFIDLTVVFFQIVFLNILVGYYATQVNFIELVRIRSIGIVRRFRETRRIDKVIILGVLMKTSLDFIVYHSIFGFNGNRRAEIVQELVQLALFLSPFNLLWAQRLDRGNRKFQRDLAAGLASSYFHGYLKQVGKLFGNSIEESQEHNGKSFPLVHWILIPRNGVILHQLCDTDQRIRFKANSKSIYIDFSGVHQRPYHLSLYEIAAGDLTICCCLEYAAALQVLEEMKDTFGFGPKEVEEIVMIFYETIIQNFDLHGKFEPYLQLLLFSGEKENIVNAIKEKTEDNAQ